MNAPDPFADWDAAYVLGSLSVTDRRTYEDHLAACAHCREAVGELAAMPGLLAGLPASEAIALQGDATAEEPPESVTALRPPRFQRPRLLLAITVVVALLLGATAGAIGGYAYRARTDPTTVRVTFDPVQPSPMSAVADLTTSGRNTVIDINCQYAATHGYPSGGSKPVTYYQLYVIDRSGHRNSVATWRAAQGEQKEPRETIHLPLSRIAALEIEYADTRQTLLRADL